MEKRPAHILPLIVFAQFAGTSLWFAGNAVLADLAAAGSSLSIGWITSMVQLGFITGTLVFAIASIADRFSPTGVFLVSTLLAAIANLLVVPFASSEISVACLRFATGFFLAGIYPVGMKIASDWFREGLGKALGYLVGALVLGTAFPHLLKAGFLDVDWHVIFYVTSLLSVVGGFMVFWLVGNGPFHATGNKNFSALSFFRLFKDHPFRKNALGYFGHMWELYAFWAFLPVFIAEQGTLEISFWSFLIIGGGSIGCIVGGYLSRKAGSAAVARVALIGSGICCLLSFLFVQTSQEIFLAFMIIWGLLVITDSPQFSTLVASSAPREYRATALSIVTSIGFSITIISIACLDLLVSQEIIRPQYLLLTLAPGPFLGLIAMKGVK